MNNMNIGTANAVPTLNYDYICSNLECHKKTNPATMAMAAFSAVTGGGMVIFAMNSSISEDMAIILSAIGIAFLLFALYLFLFRRNHIIYEPTNSTVESYSLYFPKEDKTKIQKLLNDGNPSDMPAAKLQGNLLLEVFVTKREGIAVMQLSEYIDFNYSACSQPVVFKGAEVNEIQRYVKQ